MGILGKGNKDKKILVVDDEGSVRRALTALFSADGYTVLTADNGESGLKVALEKHPDIILLDIIMPKMDGASLCQKIREDAWGASVPIIMLTNVDDIEMRNEVFKMGVKHFLVKASWELSDVRDMVKEILDES